jgi:MFS family permease
MATALEGSSIDTFWLALCYLATATCVIPLFRIFSDICGRKAIFLATLSFFALGSFIAAITGKFWGLLIGRTIQGIGAGGIWPLSNLIVSDLVSTADRKRWSTFLGAAWVFQPVGCTHQI